MTTLSFRFSPALKAQMLDTAAAAGVTPRRISRWICEQIHSLFASDPNLLSVGAGDGLQRHTTLFVLRVDEKTQELIERGFDILRSQDPRYEGVQAALVRAAIRHGIRHAGALRQRRA